MTEKPVAENSGVLEPYRRIQRSDNDSLAYGMFCGQNEIYHTSVTPERGAVHSAEAAYDGLEC